MKKNGDHSYRIQSNPWMDSNPCPTLPSSTEGTLNACKCFRYYQVWFLYLIQVW